VAQKLDTSTSRSISDETDSIIATQRRFRNGMI